MGSPSRLELAERLLRLRRSAGLSQESLARAVGVSAATVNRWERGHTSISPDAQRRLAAFEARLADTAHPPAGAGSRLSATAVVSSFVGREAELASLGRVLGRSRLVTLVGPGGVGKTRLALEVVRRTPNPRPLTVGLDRLCNRDDLLAALSAALGVRQRARGGERRALAAALRAEPCRLVLDCAEHLQAEVAELVVALLGDVPSLRVVVTSRQVLGVAEETVWAVPPLACPPPGAPASEVHGSDAVALWVERASQRARGSVGREASAEVLGELCRQLDGLPLAIELMAGWVGTLSVGEILERRRDLLRSESSAPGASTLDAVIERSWQLLGPDLQPSLAVLTVFAAPFSIDDAAAVLAAPAAATAHLLRSLVDSSWLVVRVSDLEHRFALLDLVRAFLEDRGRHLVQGEHRRRHAEHFAALGQAAAEGMAGKEAGLWMARLGASAPDIDAALAWARESGDVDLGLRLGTAVWRWWLVTGRLASGRHWLDSFLAASPRPGGDPLMTRARCAAALLAAENGDYADARGKAARALRDFEADGKLADAALAATVVGSACRYLGDPDEADAAFRRALELRRGIGDQRGVSVSLNNLALLAMDRADTDAALELFAESIALKRAIGDPLSVAIGLSNMATALARAGREPEAAAALKEAEGVARQFGNLQLLGSIDATRGECAAMRRDWAEAAHRYGAAAAAQRAGGHAHDEVVALVGLGRALHRLGQGAAATRRLHEAETLATDTGNLEGVAKVRAALGEIDPPTPSPLPAGLTAREATVLRSLAAGSRNKEIARALGISARTVDRHIANIYLKLGVNGRIEATRWALARHLAGPPPAP